MPAASRNGSISACELEDTTPSLYCPESSRKNSATPSANGALAAMRSRNRCFFSGYCSQSFAGSAGGSASLAKISTMQLSTAFFSSRRRHTRLQGDWCSDVCSSYLKDADVKIIPDDKELAGDGRDATRVVV